jgi:hypothetical protein
MKKASFGATLWLSKIGLEGDANQARWAGPSRRPQSRAKASVAGVLRFAVAVA